MNHRVANRKLGRPSDHRRALLRNQVRSLLIHDRIVTTVTRAKETRRIAEKLITTAKEDSMHARRQARRMLNDEDLVKFLFDKIAPRYHDRQGGYTRLVRVGVRRGDASEIAMLELVD
jgi:large subunit ribosomal protein L17